MNSDNAPHLMFLDENESHKTAEKIEALTNLLYLIDKDAAESAKVNGYAGMAETVLTDLRNQILPEN